MSLLGVLGGEQQQLRADRVGDVVVDHRAEEDDPLAEQPVVDLVVEAHAAGRRPCGVRASTRHPYHLARLRRWACLTSDHRGRSGSSLRQDDNATVPTASRVAAAVRSSAHGRLRARLTRTRCRSSSVGAVEAPRSLVASGLVPVVASSAGVLGLGPPRRRRPRQVLEVDRPAGSSLTWPPRRPRPGPCRGRPRRPASGPGRPPRPAGRTGRGTCRSGRAADDVLGELLLVDVQLSLLDELSSTNWVLIALAGRFSRSASNSSAVLPSTSRYFVGSCRGLELVVQVVLARAARR